MLTMLFNNYCFYIWKYCNVEMFAWGLFTRFSRFFFFSKIIPTRKYNPYAFMKEIEVVSWTLPLREMSFTVIASKQSKIIKLL